MKTVNLIILLTFIFVSCGNFEDNKTSSQLDRINLLTKKANKIRDELADYVLLSGKSAAEIVKIIEANDENEFKKAFSITTDKYNFYKNELKKIADELQEIPEVQEELRESKLQIKRCMACHDEDFIDRLIVQKKKEPLFTSSFFQTQEPIQDGDVSCKWVQYTACLILCTAGGPILYWPCAYLCMCGYCSGGNLNEVCL